MKGDWTFKPVIRERDPDRPSMRLIAMAAADLTTTASAASPRLPP
jgi:hypothetical protein